MPTNFTKARLMEDINLDDMVLVGVPELGAIKENYNNYSSEYINLYAQAHPSSILQPMVEFPNHPVALYM